MSASWHLFWCPGSSYNRCACCALRDPACACLPAASFCHLVVMLASWPLTFAAARPLAHFVCCGARAGPRKSFSIACIARLLRRPLAPAAAPDRVCSDSVNVVSFQDNIVPLVLHEKNAKWQMCMLRLWRSTRALRVLRSQRPLRSEQTLRLLHPPRPCLRLPACCLMLSSWLPFWLVGLNSVILAHILSSWRPLLLPGLHFVLLASMFAS